MGNKFKKNLKYLSFRAAIYTGLWAVSLMVLFLFFEYGYGTAWTTLGKTVLTAAVIILLLTVGYFFLTVPCRLLLSQNRRFNDGYITLSELIDSPVLYSVSSEKTLRRLEQMVGMTDAIDYSKRQAQYRALQNQINPHFLYNTLDGIRSEALLGGMDSLADMTEALASFFRYTISRTENLVTLEEELENCRTYFKIQQYRFGDRLRLEIVRDMSDWEEIRGALIPKLTLQPVLENSIIHGTELKLGEGVTRIVVERTRRRLVILVRDNGVGMEEEQLHELNRKLSQGLQEPDTSAHGTQGGVALANVNNRIRLIFGEEYGMHVYSLIGQGTDVEISIPFTTRRREESVL